MVDMVGAAICLYYLKVDKIIPLNDSRVYLVEKESSKK